MFHFSESLSRRIHNLLPSDTSLVLLLAFIGGYVDCVGYLKLANVFTSSITGNVVVASSSVHSLRGVLCRGLVTLSFTVSAALNTAISIRMKLMRYNHHIIYTVLYALEFFSLLATLIVGQVYLDIIDEHPEDPDFWAIVLVASMMAASMGFHNGAAKESIPNCPSTTVMTMTLVSIASLSSNCIGYYMASAFDGYDQVPTTDIDQFDEKKKKIAADHKALHDKYLDALAKIQIPILSLISFIVGAILGSIITVTGHADFKSLIVPLILEIGLMLTFYLRGHCAIVHTPKPVVKDVPAPKSEIEKSVELSVIKDIEAIELNGDDELENAEPPLVVEPSTD